MRQDLRTIEEFHAVRGADWLALRGLLGDIGNGSVGKLQPVVLAEFSRLYRAVSNDLAVARLRFPRSPIVTDLNRLVWHAHSVLYAEPRRFWARLGEYLVAGYPRAVRRNRWFVFAGALVFILAIVGGVIWYQATPEAAATAFDLPPVEEFNEAGVPLVTLGTGVFAWAQIAINNIIVSMSAFALGMVFCVGTGFYLAFNGIMLGVFGMHAFQGGKGVDMLALVTPHGVLELTLIVLAGAAGMRIGWALIAPGRRSRSNALVDAGREGIRVLIGSLIFLILAGAVEGLLTTAGLPPALNITIGWFVGIGFWVYLVGAGRGSAPSGVRGVPEP